MAIEEEVVDDGLGDFSPIETADHEVEQEVVEGDETPSVEESEEVVEEADEETTEDAVVDSEEEADEVVEPEIPTFKIGDEEYKANEIPPEVLAKMVTHYGQVGHYQKKYEDVNEQLHQAQQAPPQPTPEQAAPVPITPDTYKTAYDPVIKDLREKGFIGDFLAEEDPALVASMVHQVGLLDQARQIIGWQEQRLQALESQEGIRHSTNVNENVSRVFDEIAEEGDVYASLSDIETRKGLFESVGKMFEGAPNQEALEAAFIGNIMKDPKVNLKKLFHMFAESDMQDKFKKGKSKAEANAKKRRARTAGEGTSAGAAPPPKKSAVDDSGLDDFAPE